MIFKLRNEHNSHSCVWYTFTQARTQACEKAKMLHQNTKKKCWQNNATKQGSSSEADSCPLRLPSVPYLGW